MKQRGFVQLPILGWAAVAAGAAIAVLSVALWIQGARLENAKMKLETVRLEYKGFKDATRVLGEAAKKRVAEQVAKDRADKEKADAENKAAIADRDARITKLRRDRDLARSSIVPASPAGSKCPDGQACFDRAELERAHRERRAAIRGLADEGSKIETDLNTARKWAQEK